MRRRLFILLTAVSLIIPTIVHAQGTITLETLSVTLWPEYDQPSMLVIHEFTVTEDTLIPTTMDFNVPRNANITAVAYESAGNLLLANYQKKTVEDPNWQVITLFIAERATYRVEYYQPLDRNDEKRSFTYQWFGDYTINDFDISVQIPGDSTAVKTKPAIPFIQQTPFLSGGVVMNEVQQGQSYQLQLSYNRTSDEIIATPVSSRVEPLTPVDENTDGRSTLDNLPVFLGGVGVILIAVGVFFFLRGQSGAKNKPRKRSHSAQAPDSQIYCHECGTRAHSGDRFCRACGSKLRT